MNPDRLSAFALEAMADAFLAQFPEPVAAQGPARVAAWRPPFRLPLAILTAAPPEVAFLLLLAVLAPPAWRDARVRSAETRAAATAAADRRRVRASKFTRWDWRLAREQEASILAGRDVVTLAWENYCQPTRSAVADPLPLTRRAAYFATGGRGVRGVDLGA